MIRFSSGFDLNLIFVELDFSFVFFYKFQTVQKRLSQASLFSLFSGKQTGPRVEYVRLLGGADGHAELAVCKTTAGCDTPCSEPCTDLLDIWGDDLETPGTEVYFDASGQSPYNNSRYLYLYFSRLFLYPNLLIYITEKEHELVVYIFYFKIINMLLKRQFGWMINSRVPLKAQPCLSSSKCKQEN